MKKIFLMLGMAVLFSACDNFLSVTPPRYITDDNMAGEGGELTPSYYLGAYYSLTDWFISYAYPGYKSIQLASDALGQDVVGSDGIYGGVTREYKYLSTDNFTSSVPRRFWQYYFKSIATCNNGIQQFETAAYESHREESKITYAQLLALRSFAYLDVVRFWQASYEQAADLDVAPIYEQIVDAETGREGMPLSTVAEVYDFLIDGLERSVNIFEEVDYNRSSKAMINKNVAAGILARAYLTRGTKADGSGVKADMDKAAKYARMAQEGMSLMKPEEFLAGFNEDSNPEWMLDLPQSADNSDMSYIFHYMDTRSNDGRAYYKSALPDPYFRNLFDYGNGFDTSDVRFQLFEVPDSTGAPRVQNALKYTKFKFRDSEPTGDIVYMRVAEMFLIEAEAVLRGGQAERPALEIINELRAARDASQVSTVDVDFVLKERRRELWGEGEAGIFDINRTQATVHRKVIDQKDFEDYLGMVKDSVLTRGHHILSYPDRSPVGKSSHYHFFQIPEQEVLNNPMVEGQLPRL
ncbi:RagB/SusD family nutrient uptake outer membrane protein [Persicobacter psychrovividus]|uniref:Membrane protein n=1 Tax=Persicobacter psychrovividus TaxID=387638 RepID=A0ABM7VIN5_9BACT|nr:membrane protein [Persicobacter psychrovividus]